jgi:C_GCAxxG_C_C family probable redox protein
MTPEEMKEKAIQIMTKRFHCSQAVIAVVLEKLRYEPNDGLIRAMGSFGAGLAATGDVCGSAIGGLAAFGLVFSRSREEEKEDLLMWRYGQEFLRRFREEIAEGGLCCRDIIGVDWKDKGQAKSFHSSEKYRKCLRITGETAKLVGEMLDRRQLERGN